jgi:hypothetical protein
LAGGAAERPAGSARAHARLGVPACGRSLGGQGGPDASCAVVTVSAFVSGIRCPVSGASVRCSTGPVQVTGVRCERLSVQVSTVRPRASGVRPPASGVRCPCVAASAVSNGNEVAGAAWAGSRMAGMARGRRGRPPSTTARRLPEVGAWPSKLAQAVLGQRTIDLDLVVVGGGGNRARSTGWPTKIGWMRASIARR